MATSGLHISIAAEPLFTLGGLSITNSMITSLVVSGLIITFAVLARIGLTKNNRPAGLQNVAEWIVESLWNLVHSITDNNKKTNQFFPVIATFFLFILLNNWLGLLPGVGTIGVLHNEETKEVTLQTQKVSLPTDQVYATETVKEVTETTTEEQEDTTAIAKEHTESNPKFVPLFRAGTADLNMTLALALISVLLTQFFGIAHLGLAYFKKFLNFSNPIMFFVGILETISEFAKIISFAFRLFGNVFAGEVLLIVIGSLVPLIAPIPFYGLEVFVGFIQALVFAILSLVFFNMASQAHEDH